MSDIMQARKALIARLLGSRRQCYRWKVSWIRLFAVSPNSPRILFKLWQRGIHLVPRVRVACPHIHLRVEPARIIQTRRSDRDKLRFDHDR
jgi:hypothetical protein